MDLCTVISQRFIPQALNLIQSYKVNSYDQHVFVYYFDTDAASLEIFRTIFGTQVTTLPVPKVCEHAWAPRAFFYKAYAIKDCLTDHSEAMMYSDSANCFSNSTDCLGDDLIDGSLLLSYSDPRLTNEYWTTKACFEAVNAPGAEIMPQYWAGFQVYEKTAANIRFVTEMYELMLDPKVALPDTTVRYPDGSEHKCIEHRQDQSALSLLVHKHNRHQFYDIEKTTKYGDWQTIVEFDITYKPDFSKMILSPRESKFNQFRYIQLDV